MNTSDVSLSQEQVQFVDPNLRSRLGVIALATDLTSEGDIYRQVPDNRASIHVARVAFENPTTPENLKKMRPRLFEAAHLLRPVAPLDAICYSCTAASVVIGDDAVSSVINSVFPNVPVVTPSGAARSAFEALGITRISVLTPYTIDTSLPMAEYFAKRGLDIQNFQCLGIDDDRTMAQVACQSIISAVLATDTPRTEGFFISCTAFPAIDAIDRIEKLTGKPVVTSNQASAWALMKHAGISEQPSGFGVLFQHELPCENGT